MSDIQESRVKYTISTLFSYLVDKMSVSNIMPNMSFYGPQEKKVYISLKQQK